MAMWWWDCLDWGYTKEKYDVLQGPMSRGLYVERAWKRAEALWAAVRPSTNLSRHTGDTEDYLILREAELKTRNVHLLNAWVDLIITV